VKQQAEQAALFARPGEQVERIIEKVRSALDPDELALFTSLVEQLLPKTPKTRDTARLVAAWRSEYQRACGAPCPRLTPNEGHALKNICSRVGGVEAALELVSGFWSWRESLVTAGAMAPRPDPFGLLKNLASVQEHLAKTKKTKTAVAATAARLRDAESSSRVSGPTLTQVRAFVAELRR
jgi:hypothetical protein